jgi:hypothetical protein
MARKKYFSFKCRNGHQFFIEEIRQFSLFLLILCVLEEFQTLKTSMEYYELYNYFFKKIKSK